MTMTHEEFMNEMLRPTYVWRMAHALLLNDTYFAKKYPDREPNRVVKGAPKRRDDAQKAIDDLVLKRAEAIIEERAVKSGVHVYPQVRTKSSS